MSARLSKQHSALILAYAEANGLKRRTAQHHRKIGDPKWAAFAAVHGADIVVAPPVRKTFGSPEPGVPEELRDYSGLCLPEEMERRFEDLWRYHSEAAERAKSVPAMALLHAKLAGDLFDKYQRARRERIAAQIEAKELTSAAVIREFLEVVYRIAERVTSIDKDLVEKVNPEHPEVAFAAIHEWKVHVWNPYVQSLRSAGIALLPAA